jgi:uncharacterized protein
MKLCIPYKDNRMLFIADAMLGTLARWLRAAGQDVYFDPSLPDSRIMRIAREQNRILLTRDTHLLRVRDVPPHIFIRDDALASQLAQVIREAPLTLDETTFMTRCLQCNGLLQEVSRESVRDQVYPYVYATQRTFRTCPDCGRIYWQGTHVPNLLQKLRALLSAAANIPPPADK